MANNKLFTDGRKLNLPVTAGTVSGSPCAVGSRCGVAQTDRDAAGNATIDFKGVYNLTVTGITAIGTPVYYTENASPLLRLAVTITGIFFGYALGVKGAPAGLVAVYVSEASGISQVPAGTLNGTTLANVANVGVIGGIPVLHRIDVPDVAGNTDVTLTHKTRVIDFWFLNTGVAAHATDDTIRLFNVGNAITPVMPKTAAVFGIVRAATMDPARVEIAAGTVLRITAAKGVGTLNVAVTAYVLGVRIT